jgi:hypothetical protein
VLDVERLTYRYETPPTDTTAVEGLSFSVSAGFFTAACRGR